MLDSYSDTTPAADDAGDAAETVQSPEAVLAQLAKETNQAAMFAASSRTRYFFAYDTLMDQSAIARYVKGLRPAKVVSLPNHRLIWPYYLPPRSSGIPSLERTNMDGDEVWGILYDAGNKDFKPLERFLKLPNRYHRVGVKPQDRGGRIFPAFTYVLTISDDLPSKPSSSYKELLIGAARERGLPDEWIGKLEALETGG